MEKAVQSLQTSDISRDIRYFLVRHFLDGRTEKLRDDGSLLGNAVDSLGVLDLVTFLQDHFHITVEDEDVVPSNLDTVNNLISFVARKLRAKEQV
jgi:acyl carrier protein